MKKNSPNSAPKKQIKHKKRELKRIVHNFLNGERIAPQEIDYLLTFKPREGDPTFIRLLKTLAFPMSLLFGALMAAFALQTEDFVSSLPSWTNLGEEIQAALNYLWNIIGEPVESPNIIYHLPNFILYGFGVIGLKALIDSLNKNSWVNKVIYAQEELKKLIENGTLNLNLSEGHSILFVGKGDFIGTQIVLDMKDDEAVTIAQKQQAYTKIWQRYNSDSLYLDLKEVLEKAHIETAGEYIFFPVKDDQIFLPGPKDYDLSPHKLDVLVQNIRTIEQEIGISEKRIIIVGDRFHKSTVKSEDEYEVIHKSEENISLETIAKKYKNITVIDPTDIVIRDILQRAEDRRIVFRATEEGMREYKERFYERLKELKDPGIAENMNEVVVGYDLFDYQVEQQSISQKQKSYIPIIISKNVYDELLRHGYKEKDFIYVPSLVIEHIKMLASEQ